MIGSMQIHFFKPYSTKLETNVSCEAMISHVLNEHESDGYRKYQTQNSMEANCSLYLKSLSSPSIISIGHCLELMAALSERTVDLLWFETKI